MGCEAETGGGGGEEVGVQAGELVREEAVGQLVGFCCCGGVAC